MPRAYRRPKKRQRATKECRGKVRYRDHAEAVRVLQNIRTKGDEKEKTPCRAYECPRCKGFHLTSQEK